MKKKTTKQVVKKRKKAVEQFLDPREEEDEVEEMEPDYDEDIPDEEEDEDDGKKHSIDGATVIDFRGVPATGQAVQFAFAGGKVKATVLHMNPDGTFKARAANGINYPRVHKGDIMEEGDTAAQHYGKRQLPAAVGKTKARTATGTFQEPARGSKIAQILDLFKSGKSKQQIIDAGFNKSTVNRQVGEYIKRQQK